MASWLKSLIAKPGPKKLYYQAILPTDMCQFRVKLYDVPISVPRPQYVLQGQNIEEDFEKRSRYKFDKEIESCRRVGKIARKVMDYALESVAIGMMSHDLDVLIFKKIIGLNAYPSLLGYRDYVRSCFISVNNIANHGMPDYRCFREGDIICIDFSVYYQGCHADLAETILLGEVDKYGIELVENAKKCMNAGISVCRDGTNLHAIGAACKEVSLKTNYAILPQFVGHGIGQNLYESPQIPFDGSYIPGKMETGMIFTIEPTLVEGVPSVYQWPNKCTYATKDKGRAAKFERTILITDNGAEILT